MRVVIMAGEKGTRLSSVLKDIPNPMVDFAGKPLLERQIDNLKENGITDIISCSRTSRRGRSELFRERQKIRREYRVLYRDRTVRNGGGAALSA